MQALHVFSPALAALLQVILIDITLAGDNAIVIGAAAARTPLAERRRVMLWGLVAAVILRLIVAYIIIFVLLKTSFFLVIAGGFLLLWVTWRLYRDVRRSNEEAVGAQTIAGVREREAIPDLPSEPGAFGRAIMQIAVADLSMSLDNVLAVAGAAMNHVWVLAIGLLLSIALMGAAASLIARILHRYPWIGYAGVIIVFYVACRMILTGGMALLHAR
ncbi:MAG TPA: YjbE family putative metal transport protein [Rhizomicrobium sp.]|nr:YjbE family putative metal transport protein [Rhizomicrobium sp.]